MFQHSGGILLSVRKYVGTLMGALGDTLTSVPRCWRHTGRRRLGPNSGQEVAGAAQRGRQRRKTNRRNGLASSDQLSLDSFFPRAMCLTWEVNPLGLVLAGAGTEIWESVPQQMHCEPQETIVQRCLWREKRVENPQTPPTKENKHRCLWKHRGISPRNTVPGERPAPSHKELGSKTQNN